MLNQQYNMSAPVFHDRQTALTYYGINALLFVCWLAAPVLSVFPICLFLLYFNPSKPTYYFYFFLIASVPAFINCTKVPVSDLEMYNDSFKQLYQSTFSNVVKTFLLDPFFYYTSFLLVKISSGNYVFPLFFWTTYTYFVFFLALYQYDDLFPSGKRGRLVLIVFFATFIGLDFQLSAHLVRQCAALSSIMYGIALFCNGKKEYRMFIAIGCLTHFSMVIFIPLLIIATFRNKSLSISIGTLVILAFLIGSMNILQMANTLGLGAGNPIMQLLAERAEMYEEKDDGSISLRLVIEMLVYFLAACVVLWRRKRLFNEEFTQAGVRKFFIIYICFCLFVFLIKNNMLLALRFFFFLYPLSTFAIFTFSRLRSYIIYAIFLLLVITAPMRFFAGIEASAFVFIANSPELLYYSIVDFIRS